jgi:hypothetical protein
MLMRLLMVAALASASMCLSQGAKPSVPPQDPQPKVNDSSIPAGDAPIQRSSWWSDSNWWLVLVATGTAGVIGWQSWETRKTAKAANRQAEIASDTAKRQLRAYICIAKSELRFLDDGTIEAILYLENAGQTPAYDVEGWSRITFREYPPQLPLGDAPSDLPKGVAIVPPNHFHIVTPRKFSMEGNPLEALDFGTHALYVYGKTTYRDIFKELHFLNYRLIHGGSAKTRTATDDKGRKIAFLAMDAEGNEGD